MGNSPSTDQGRQLSHGKRDVGETVDWSQLAEAPNTNTALTANRNSYTYSNKTWVSPLNSSHLYSLNSPPIFLLIFPFLLVIILSHKPHFSRRNLVWGLSAVSPTLLFIANQSPASTVSRGNRVGISTRDGLHIRT